MNTIITPPAARLSTGRVLVALGIVLVTTSCGVGGRVASVVAERPLSYSEDERLDEIDRLDGRIASEMSRLGLTRSESVTKISSEPDEPTIPLTLPEADDDGPPAPVHAGVTAADSGSRRTGRSWCERVCDSARAICEAADKICRIADSLPGHPTARDRCARAREDCTAARSKGATCDCG